MSIKILHNFGFQAKNKLKYFFSISGKFVGRKQGERTLMKHKRKRTCWGKRSKKEKVEHGEIHLRRCLKMVTENK